MAAPLPLRADFDAAGLRRLARQPREPGQTRRLPSPSKDGACGDLGGRGAPACGLRSGVSPPGPRPFAPARAAGSSVCVVDRNGKIVREA